ncbi:saccharopine dehydrogenase family protein [Chitinophaga japonensis]|uniref:Short subunit dehydrogenase-like uncharacterized protein n=1 Tax=Chitinophaga japonensis TaxID=104662 RepID=A0A562SST3_CHIJA|nr:saccharopine dehydrogenase NADP-binding domain-containing protein [Chitinophaga japonensis]TWI84272.1 short subunit dehydrogenase-like uncharacterized protein [Chitinophaga japonensis]
MQSNSFLLYGAYGYTGELIARYAAQYNLQPVLAGRREAALAALAGKLHLPYIALDLDNAPALQEALHQVKVVVHAAGPYDFTARQMITACLQTGTHYIDLNGDPDIFEMIRQYDAAAQAAGVMLLPGAGFDVVPTDCLALFLKKAMPAATRLQLAFTILGSTLSHGTAINTLQKLGDPGAARINGAIVREPVGQEGMWVDFGVKRMFTCSLPWGDVATAFYSTGIPNIRSYTTMPLAAFWLLKIQSLFNWLLRKPGVRNFLKKQVKRRPAGPDDNMRSRAVSLVWGRVTDAQGHTVTARLRTPEAYDVTAYAVLHITRKILEGHFTAGYQTPATAYGEDLVTELPNVHRELV